MVYELIKEELGDLSLMIRPTFNMAGEEDLDVIINQSESLGPDDLLKEQLGNYGDESVIRLGLDLYHFLSKDKIEESEDILKQFFDENYHIANEYVELNGEEIGEEPSKGEKEIQVTFKEALE